MSEKLPQTLQEAIIYFADPDMALRFAVSLRWPEGITCPRCGSGEHSFLSTRRVWKCKSCRKQFSVKVGTIFEDSPIPLGKWFAVIWMLANCKNGVSSYEIARAIGVTQKTAWFMLHRIRIAMKSGTVDKKLAGIVESDETFIGGSLKNMHKSARERKGYRGRPGKKNAGPLIGKAIVQGVLERDGEVRAQVIKDLSTLPRCEFVQENVEKGSDLITDEGSALMPDFIHSFINHQREYVRGNIHTQGIENFWSLLKRGLKGTYVSVEPFHLSAYVDEQSFRYNTRKKNDADRFVHVLSKVAGRRLTYRDLTQPTRRGETTGARA